MMSLFLEVVVEVLLWLMMNGRRRGGMRPAITTSI